MGRQIVGCLVQSQGVGGVVERVRGVRLFISKVSIRKLRLPSFFSFLFFFFFCCTLSIWKFLGQGLNPSHSSDIAGSLTTRPPGNSQAEAILTTVGLYLTPSWAVKNPGQCWWQTDLTFFFRCSFGNSVLSEHLLLICSSTVG